jgi:lipoxygenase
VVTVQETAANLLSTLSLTAPLDRLNDFIGKTFLLELVSTDLDPSKLAS